MANTHPTNRRLSRGRFLVVLAAALLFLSVSLLLIASTSPGRFEEGKATWEGIVDVSAALALAGISFLIHREARQKIGSTTWQISYHLATVLPTALFVAMWLFQSSLTWNVLLPGLAWRTWLLLYTLPAALAAWKQPDAAKETARS